MKQKRRILHIVLAALIVATLIAASLPSQAFAAGDGTTVGTLTLAPAFENIGVISSFSDDDNGNNNAILEYREVGASTWTSGITMTVDRRDYLYEFPLAGEEDNNPVPNEWKNQWRAVIFGLQPNTEYQVRVTYTDPDGVSGSPAVATVGTRNDAPVSNGNTYYVANNGADGNLGTFDAPFETITHAIDVVVPGDTIMVMPGTYYEVNWEARPGIIIDKSGTEENYITIRSYDLENKAVIDGQSTLWFGFWLRNASYVRIQGFDLKNFDGDPGGGIVIGSDSSSGPLSQGCIIEDCTLADPGGSWASACILVRYAKDYLIQHNTMTTTGIGGRAESYGVFFLGSQGGATIRENTVTTEGVFKDAIGGVGNMRIWGGPGPNSFIYDNYAYGSWDDGLEIEGGNLNVAVWGNTTKNNSLDSGSYPGASMNMGLGLTSTIVGPLYAFRNIVINHGDAAIKLGSNSYGNIYIYHNTIYSPQGGAGPSHFGNNAVADNVCLRNNIIITGGGRSVEIWGDPSDDHGLNDWDYDAFWSTRDIPHGFKGVWYTARYGTLASFQEGTGLELHGLEVENPQFINPDADDLRLDTSSPCVDQGALIPGFNDGNSPWPYQGLAPDIGAYELDSGPPPPPGPLHHITIAPASSSLTFGQNQQFTATGYDENNRQLTGISFSWSVTNPEAGTINANGLFTAGVVEGTYPDVVRAESESIAAYASVSIAAPPPNEPPVAVDDTYSVDEDNVLTIAAPGVLANDSDANDDTLIAIPTSDVSHGTLILNDDGSFSYTPDAGYVGSDSFTYVANDGQADSNTATVSITVNTSGSPPGDTTTFGLDSGDDTWGEAANVISGMKFTCLDDGTLSEMGLLIDDSSPSGNVKVAIYDHDTENDLPQNLLWGGNSTPVTDGWMEWTTSPVQLTKDTDYWLVLWIDVQNGIRYQSDAGRHIWWYESYSDWPAVLDDNPHDTNTKQYVMQATYTIDAGPLDHIVVMPATVDVGAGGSQQFTAIGYDQYDNEVPITPSWSTDVGTIDENGLFTAQDTAGANGYVKATVDAIEGQAVVNIVDGYTPGDADGDGSVTSLDITKLERIIMGLDDPTAGADANEDGSVNTLDITRIELIIMGG